MRNNTMKILITGALGQIGKPLVKKLLEKNESIIGLDKREDVISETDIIHPEITIKKDIKKYSDVLKDVDILIHLASLITNDKDVLKSGSDSVDLNIKGTINLLEFLPNLKSIVFTSTYMVYGTPTIMSRANLLTFYQYRMPVCTRIFEHSTFCLAGIRQKAMIS